MSALKLTTLCASIALLLNAAPVNAETATAHNLIVKNENQKDLDIVVKAENSKTKAEQSFTIPGTKMMALSIKADMMGGADHYLIEGKAGSVPFTGSECNDISTDKMFKVTFKDVSTGTKCTKEELTKEQFETISKEISASAA